MAPIIPAAVPRHFPAGTTVKYTRSFGEFQPSDGWGYTLYLNGLTQKFNKPATVLDNIFQIELVPSDTAGLAPGAYRYAERLTRPAATLTLTAVSGPDANGKATYSYSAVSGPAPQEGAIITVTGFTNSGNNIAGAIGDLTPNSFTLSNSAAVPETHAGSGAIAASVYDLRGDELVINIEPNVDIAAAGTFNTWEEKTLAVIELALTGRLTNHIQSYMIAGLQVNKIPID